MNEQDFEAYADFKRFEGIIADSWDSALADALQLIGRPNDQVVMLDYGCGDGRYFNHLVQRGLVPKHIYGIEVSKRRVDRCRQMGWNNAQLLPAKALLPYSDGMFDLVNCIEVIEHIPFLDGRKVVNELRRVLRPGGILLVATPNYPIKRFYDVFDAVFHGKWTRLRDDPTHVSHYNTDSLKQILHANFRSVAPRLLKPGFLYKRFPKPFFLHKLFFLCQA